MEFKDIFELEYYEGEVINDEWVSAHCEIIGVKHPEEIPEDLIIPNLIDDEYYVTEIYPDIFKNMKSLKSVRINAPIEKIGANAFEGCENLAHLKICVRYLEAIGYNAFLGCVNLRTLELFEKTDIESWCEIRFANKFANPLVYAKLFTVDGERLTDIYMRPLGNTMYIREFSFAGSEIRSFVMSENIWYIEKFAFLDCEKLKDVILSDSLKEIQEDAFKGCDQLFYTEHSKLLYLGSKKTQHFAVIKYAKKCAEYYTASSAKLIANGAFKDNDAVISLDLHFFETDKEFGVETIGREAFKNCVNLNVLTVSPGLRSVGEDAFKNTAVVRIRLRSLEDWQKVEFAGQDSSPLHGTELYTYEIYRSGEPITEIVVPSGVKKLLPYCFAGCTTIKKVTISDGVKAICAYAFKDCTSLKEIIIPDSVESIGSEAFSGCTNLTVIAGDRIKNMIK